MIKPHNSEIISITNQPTINQIQEACNLAKERYAARLGLLEELKELSFGAVWDYYCWRQDVPVGFVYMDEIQIYEKRVLALRR